MNFDTMSTDARKQVLEYVAELYNRSANVKGARAIAARDEVREAAFSVSTAGDVYVGSRMPRLLGACAKLEKILAK